MKLTKYLITSTVLASSTLTCLPVVASCSKKEDKTTATITYIGDDKSFTYTGQSAQEILYFKTDSQDRTMLDTISFKILNQTNYKLNLSVSDIGWDSFVNGTFHCVIKWSFAQTQTGYRSEYTNFDLRCQYINTEKLSACADITFTGFSLTLRQNP